MPRGLKWEQFLQQSLPLLRHESALDKACQKRACLVPNIAQAPRTFHQTLKTDNPGSVMVLPVRITACEQAACLAKGC